MPSDSELDSAIVAEGHSYWHSMLRQTLPECGLEPLMKRSAEEAINLASSTTARLVIFGTWLPDMNGVGACGRLRRLPDYVSVPVIILSTLDNTEMHADAVQAWGALLLTVPVSIQQLRRTILSLLGEAPDKPIASMPWPPKSEPIPLPGGLQGLTQGRQVPEFDRQPITGTSFRRTNYSR